MEKIPSRFPSENELQRADSLVEMAIMSGCWRCNRRLWGEDVEVRGQIIQPRKTPTLGFVVLCEICVVELQSKGKL